MRETYLNLTLVQIALLLMEREESLQESFVIFINYISLSFFSLSAVERRKDSFGARRYLFQHLCAISGLDLIMLHCLRLVLA